jgi:hypothetical protein
MTPSLGHPKLCLASHTALCWRTEAEAAQAKARIAMKLFMLMEKLIEMEEELKIVVMLDELWCVVECVHRKQVNLYTFQITHDIQHSGLNVTA